MKIALPTLIAVLSPSRVSLPRLRPGPWKGTRSSHRRRSNGARRPPCSRLEQRRRSCSAIRARKACLGHDRPRATIEAVRDRAAVRPLGDREAADHRRHGRGPGGSPARCSRRSSGRCASAPKRDWPWKDCPTSRPRGERDGFYQAQLIRELAIRHITTWTGVDLEGGPAPPHPEHRRGYGAVSGGRAILPGVHAPPGAAQCGKTRLRALCRWHFQPAGGPEYCRACRDDDLPCARGEPGADGRLCPYREHALISRQEHEAWDVLLACQGQLRLARSGHVVGIEMAAALEIAAARRCDLAVFSELSAAAEAGLVETLCSDRVRG